ncbi:hypothetical protein [Ralstonia pseudosolanacearum]|uniref:hypothetical protein n=1 Tax=Ralstonia pseudosolanacearum TaxID=1310165 RepID=UPI0020C77A5B|nr:hypothetical protein [Ralstonia pseudosolanacearum]
MSPSIIRSVSSAAVVSLCMWMAPIQSAHAETASLTCQGTEVVQYNPPLTFVPTSITATVQDNYAPCTGSPATISSASTNISDTVVRSCDVLTNSATKPNYTVRWSDGTTSEIYTQNVVVQRPVGQVVRIESGSVVSGRFTGANTLRTVTLLQSDVQACMTSGVSSVGGPVVLQVTGPAT